MIYRFKNILTFRIKEDKSVFFKDEINNNESITKEKKEYLIEEKFFDIEFIENYLTFENHQKKDGKIYLLSKSKSFININCDSNKFEIKNKKIKKEKDSKSINFDNIAVEFSNNKFSVV
jgi:hypothetical protein